VTDRMDARTGPDERRAELAMRLRRRITERDHPLSYPQQRLWFLDQLDPGNAVYVIPLTYEIRGDVDVAALGAAVTGLVHRHQVLRTCFRAADGMPRQFVGPPVEVTVTVHDVSGLDDPAAAAEDLCRAEATRPFDLGRDLLIRPALVRLGPREHRLCLTVHHIACDGWSLGLIVAELSELYRATTEGRAADLPELPMQYADFARWQMSGEADAENLGYWKDRLAGLPALATLPTDHPRPPTQSYAGDHLDFEIDAAVAAQVVELAEVTAAAPFSVLLAAFAALARAYTGAPEIVVGVPVAARHDEKTQRLVGFVANTVVHRIDVSGRPKFAELVARTRDEGRAALAHQDLPFEKLVEELHPSRDPAYNPIFQLMFNYHDGDSDGLELPGCDVRVVPGHTATSKFDLTMSVTRTADRFTARLEYATDLFDADTAQALAEQFRRVLAAGVAQPLAPVDRLPVLSEADLRRILVDGNSPAEPVPDALVHELVAAQAVADPTAHALVGTGRSAAEIVTYGELDRRVAALADRLVARGVRPDEPVAVYLDRSPDLVVTVLAIMRAGGAYLPLDPAYPADRLTFMVEDSRARFVVTRAGLVRRLAGMPATLVPLDAPADGEPDVTGRPAPAIGSGHLAYVIYTSGSTGRPKGVQISHGNVVNFFAGIDRVLGDDDPGTWLAVTSMSFDISVLELLWTLARGYRVVVRGDEPTASTALAARQSSTPVTSAVQARPMDFSLFYFGGDRGGSPQDAYRLLMEGARFADRNGFAAVWTPERHFHQFGGFYPNPAVTAAAVAAITQHVDVRAGSVVLPLHDPLQVAEEWSVVDNMSHGRVGLSVASGWQPNDFVLAPDSYADRKKIMMHGLEELRTLWRGGSVTRRNGVDVDTDVRIFPAPVQAELPVWVTSARSVETFQLAGEIGAGLLTHLLGHTVEQLAHKIALYRQAWRDAGHAGDGHVTLMLHTFVGPDSDVARDIVREPLCAYIKSSLDLLAGLGEAMGREVDIRSLPEDELDALVAQAFDRFFETAGLLGTPAHCADLVDQLKGIGINEVACLLDFGVEHQLVLDSLDQLALVHELSEERRRVAAADEPVAAQLSGHGVTGLQCTPSMAAVLVDDEEARGAIADLKRLLVGGEALPDRLASELSGLVPGSVHNMYGPTEATVWATTSSVDGSAPVTIGRPMTNVRAYVVDPALRPVPVNVPGELLLGGAGIARGYLDRPALTAERFVPDPFGVEPGARLYRTGDLVRRRPDGDLEFLGRLDHQVKLHGHRIELGEVESTLLAHPALRAAIAVVRGDEAHGRIVAYCVPYDGEPAADELRTFVAATSPDYMVPADVVFLPELPRTPNGKVDRNRLPDPESRPAVEYRPPDSDVERQVGEALAAILKIERMGMDDNFFEVGGNSLLAVQARAKLRPLLGDELTLVDIFRYPTVRRLVAALAGPEPQVDQLVEVRAQAGRRAEALARQARRRGRAGV